MMMKQTRTISSVKAAQRDFERFPGGAQIEIRRALAFVSEGGHPQIAKPPSGFDSGMLELALRFRGDAYRVVYAVQIGEDVWVLHAFQKKSKAGIKTPKAETDLVRERLKRLKEALNGKR